MPFNDRAAWAEKLAQQRPELFGDPKPRGAAQPSQPAKPKEARIGAPKRSPESELQTACVDWFRDAFPALPYRLFAVPNGGKRAKRTAAQLKREGTTSGVFDMFLMTARGGFFGCWLEAKIGRNDTSDNQDEFAQVALDEGFQTVVFWTLDQFKDLVVDYLDQAPTVALVDSF